MKYKYLSLIPIAISITGCANSSTVIGDPDSYEKEIQTWQHSRLERLKGETGWLNLAGLYWLEEGGNRFGSDPSNDIIFPEKAKAYCGKLTLKDGNVMLQVEEGIDISSGDSLVYHMELINDHSKNTTYLQQGDLSWNIIKRGEKYGIRMRDYKHPRISQLDHIPSYPIQTEYVVEATLVPFEEPKTMTVATPIEGFTEEYSCPGELHFRLNRKNLVLFPFISGKQYFLVIADETTGLETYGAGRYMYSMPDSTGRIILDFNKAYNPPCAFSPFATCPMPPKENFLPVAVEAGEKSVHFDF
ncbi:MAG: DUF1684 domain-containing protein [Bacteroidales bacterium]|nr:DUF1684 domain-containing protein [Bacteroidales bacterium]